MPVENRLAVLKAIWRDKMHVEPRALELSPPSVRDSYAHIWEPADVLIAELKRLPLGSLLLWRDNTRGHLVFTHSVSAYQPGFQNWHRGELESVCYVSLVDLREHMLHAILPVLNLLDHLMGSGAQEGQPWLSDGGGVTTPLCSVGTQFLHLYALGYGQEALGASNEHDYFARTFYEYLYDPRRLNTLDPLIHKLYRDTLMRESFWGND